MSLLPHHADVTPAPSRLIRRPRPMLAPAIAAGCFLWSLGTFDPLPVRAAAAGGEGGHEAEVALEVHEELKSAPAIEMYNLHGQGTVVYQGYGSMNSPYEGDNSAPGSGQARETVSITPSIGVRLWQGAEAYINPEIFQGFGIAMTHGFGGFPNGEAQKGGSTSPQIYLARGYVSQTFGFGGEQQWFRSDFNQLGGTKDVDRLTFTVGRMAVNDIFDRNSVSQDARDGFLNYALWESGAFDYAADQKGYGGGAVVDFNQKYWAFRTGYYLQPEHSNANTLSWSLGRVGQAVAELELRHDTWGLPGALRLLGWQSQSYAGSYAAAIQDPNFDPQQSIVDTRRIRTQEGYAINGEQRLSEVMSAFARYSWRDGKSEIMSWTDIDRSLAGGLVIKGKDWGRPNDRIQIGAALNHLTAEHSNYLAAGGLGVTVGDGQITYAGERMLEASYALWIGGKEHNALTFDYQYITNPAYNADRGPVSLFAVRLHGEF